MPSFELTARQREGNRLLASPATHCLLYGGSRSGKTFLVLRAIVLRALKAERSRHAVLRFRFAHVKASVIEDTFPKLMRGGFPERRYRLDRSTWFAEFENGAQIWFGGLDDKERVEKVLGQEHASIFLNEASQISWSARNVALTRLAQACTYTIDGGERALKRKMYYDCNPPNTAHWLHRLFIEARDPETKQPLADPGDYAHLQMNPVHNREHLPEGYIESTLAGMPARMRRRFLDGVFADATPNQLFPYETIEKWRVLDGRVPDFQRVLVGVDPSGAGDEDNANNDEIGVSVAALGTDGNAYVLEDLTVKAGPATWGTVATTAFDRHAADLVVGEGNFGGAMVEHVIQTSRARTPYKQVHASRGKVVRAEPISALYEAGKVRHVGRFGDLEDELTAFTTYGYTGEGSPNRADALIWVLTELFPGLVAEPVDDTWTTRPNRPRNGGWMAA